MTLNSIVMPLAVAAVLAVGSAPPASAAIFGGDFGIQFRPSQPIDQSSLTPAERTQLEDQCRSMQTENAQGISNSQFQDDDNNSGVGVNVRATRQYCIEIGIV
jgi:hypothetical protein